MKTYKQSERKIKRQAYNEGVGRQFEHYHLDFVQVGEQRKIQDFIANRKRFVKNS